MPASPSCSSRRKASSCALRVVLLDDGVADVRPVEAADEDARVAELEALDDVGARQRVGGRGEGDPRHVGEALVQQRQLEVVLAEVVAPLADAVRLVDREHRQQAALVQRLELGEHARRGDALGRGVEEDQAAAHHLALDPRRRLAVERRVEEGGVDAGFLERRDLVLHQRDQRADDDGDAVAGAVADDRRHLVAQALAAAGRHQDERVAAGADVLDDLFLRAAEGGVAEHLAEDLARGGGGARRRAQGLGGHGRSTVRDGDERPGRRSRGLRRGDAPAAGCAA